MHMQRDKTPPISITSKTAKLQKCLNFTVNECDH